MSHSILLHICCAPCATWVTESLGAEGYEVTGYFYNPNIQPKSEYEHRLREVERWANEIELPVIIGLYDVSRWFKLIQGLEHEPEYGLRCRACYKMRLNKTAQMAQIKGYTMFTTTLTISPHKLASIINPIGQEVGERYGVKFLARDFKKRDGFKQSVILSKKYSLYRQSYCGCEFSKTGTRDR